MDPLSIIASATGLVTTTAKLVKLLHQLHGTLEDAPILLASIIAECTVVHTSLGILRDTYVRQSTRLGNTDQVSDAFEIAFASCALILSVLEKDVQACLQANKSPQNKDAIKKLKLILEKDHLLELVTQLRGQQQALTLLINSLQSRALEEINVNIDDNRQILGGLAKHARRLYIESDHFSIADESTNEPDESIEIESVVSSTRFAFDNEVLASGIYQRTLAYLHRLELRQAEVAADRSDLSPVDEYTDLVGEDSASSYTAVQRRSEFSGPLIERNRSESETVAIAQPTGVQPETSQQGKIEDGTTNHQWERLQLDFGPDWAPREPDPIPAITIDSPVDDPKALTTAAAVVPPVLTTSSMRVSRDPPDTSINSSTPDAGSAVASHGKTGGLLLDQMFDRLWAQAAVRTKYDCVSERKSVWVGDTDCGKTCTLIAGHRGTFPLYCPPTVFENYLSNTYLDNYHFQLGIWDTAGFESFDRLRPLSYPDSHVVVVCFKVQSMDSLDNIQEKWFSEIDHFLPTIPRILVGCQLDLRDDLKEARFYDRASTTYAQGLEVAKKIDAVAYLECSAKTGEGLELLFETITKCCVLGDSDEWRNRFVTKRNNALSFSRMFRRRSQGQVNSSSTSGGQTADPKFRIVIDYSWRDKADSGNAAPK